MVFEEPGRAGSAGRGGVVVVAVVPAGTETVLYGARLRHVGELGAEGTLLASVVAGCRPHPRRTSLHGSVSARAEVARKTLQTAQLALLQPGGVVSALAVAILHGGRGCGVGEGSGRTRHAGAEARRRLVVVERAGSAGQRFARVPNEAHLTVAVLELLASYRAEGVGRAKLALELARLVLVAPGVALEPLVLRTSGASEAQLAVDTGVAGASDVAPRGAAYGRLSLAENAGVCRGRRAAGADPSVLDCAFAAASLTLPCVVALLVVVDDPVAADGDGVDADSIFAVDAQVRLIVRHSHRSHSSDVVDATSELYTSSQHQARQRRVALVRRVPDLRSLGGRRDVDKQERVLAKIKLPRSGRKRRLPNLLHANRCPHDHRGCGNARCYPVERLLPPNAARPALLYLARAVASIVVPQVAVITFLVSRPVAVAADSDTFVWVQVVSSAAPPPLLYPTTRRAAIPVLRVPIVAALCSILTSIPANGWDVDSDQSDEVSLDVGKALLVKV
mmetsp:Transcript_25055/g.56547  ORF Transcript_25055/g.56547 Transcript_25055/m.56547 type:complete len:506 (-) Transcript_25055:972-2489(-)